MEYIVDEFNKYNRRSHSLRTIAADTIVDINNDEEFFDMYNQIYHTTVRREGIMNMYRHRNNLLFLCGAFEVDPPAERNEEVYSIGMLEFGDKEITKVFGRPLQYKYTQTGFYEAISDNTGKYKIMELNKVVEVIFNKCENNNALPTLITYDGIDLIRLLSPILYPLRQCSTCNEIAAFVYPKKKFFCVDHAMSRPITKGVPIGIVKPSWMNFKAYISYVDDFREHFLRAYCNNYCLMEFLLSEEYIFENLKDTDLYFADLFQVHKVLFPRADYRGPSQTLQHFVMDCIKYPYYLLE